jgi:hypothetical protein
MKPTTPYILSLLLAPGLAACSSSTTPPVQGGPGGGTSIGVEGGVVQHESGLELTVPEGAVTGEVSITVEQLAEPPVVDTFTVQGPAFLLGPEGQTFGKPVTIKLPIEGTALPANMHLGLHAFTAPGGTTDFTELVVDAQSDTSLTTSTTHFSVFVPGTLSPRTLASGEKYPLAITSDADFVYWTNHGNGTLKSDDGNDGFIFRVSKADGAVVPLTAALPDPRALAVDATHVYWVNGGDIDGGPGGTPLPGSIHRAAKDGSNAELVSEASFPVSIALDATHVYWGDADTNEIRRAPLAGGASELVASGVSRPEFMVLDEAAIYWTGGTDGTVSTVAKAGGAVTTLATGQIDARGLTLLGANVIWADTGAGVIRSVPKAGGAITDVIATSKPLDVLALDGSIIFSDEDLGAVAAVPAEGGDAVVLCVEQDIPWRLYADESTLYWSNAGLYPFEGAVVQHQL